MRSRVLALLAAVGMLVLAVNLRARIDDNGSDTHRPLIVCAVEARAACDALDDDARVQVEAAGDTAARLIAAQDEPPLDGWVVPAPWPDIVRAERVRAGAHPLLRPGDVVLARSSVVIAVWPDRTAVLEKACGTVNWACLVRAARAPAWTALGGEAAWGAPKLALGQPLSEGVGPAVLGSAAAELAPDDPLGSDDLRGAFAAIARAGPRPLPSFDIVLAGGPALADAYVTVEAVARTDRLRLIYPSPVAAADMVLTTASGAVGPATADRARRALERRGWRAPSASATLAPAVLAGLRTMWSEGAR
jgi:hypothetical protein